MIYETNHDLEDTFQLCQNLGGVVFVPENSEKIAIVSSLLDERESSWIFSGLCTNLTGDWVNINTGKPMTFSSWDKVQIYYNNTSDIKCLWYNLEDDIYSESTTSNLIQPICEIPSLRTFFLRGVCEDVEVDAYFIMESPTVFMGYVYSKIVFSKETYRWKMIDTRNNITVAITKEASEIPPLGAQEWHFPNNKDCMDVAAADSEGGLPSDPGDMLQFRTLNLHIEVEQPGHYCCLDGTCIKSYLVCDGTPDCKEEEDEQGCKDVNVPSFYNPNIPPTKVVLINREKTIKPTNMEVNVEILEILSVDEADSSFEIFYDLNFQWYDEHLEYEFLKDYEDSNIIRNMSSIWYPQVKFFHIKEATTLEKKITISKDSSFPATMSHEHTELNVREIYDGLHNRLRLSMKMTQEIVCSFDNVQYFPFKDEECHLKFFLEGVANTLVNLDPCNIKDSGPLVVNQYNIKEWRIEKSRMAGSGDTIVKVTLLLSRQFSGIFLVTYLPTIMMNIINQASNYIQNENKGRNCTII